MAVPLDDVALEVVQQGDVVHVPVEVRPLAAQRVRAPLGDQEHVVDALLGLVTGDGMDTWDCQRTNKYTQASQKQYPNTYQNNTQT